MKSGQAPQNPFEKIKDMAQEVDNLTKLGGTWTFCSDSWLAVCVLVDVFTLGQKTPLDAEDFCQLNDVFF